MLKNYFIGLILILLCSTLNAKDLTYFLNNTDEDNLVVELDINSLLSLDNKSTFTVHLNEDEKLKFTLKKKRIRKNGSIKFIGKNKEKKAKILLTYLNNTIYGDMKVGKEIYKIAPSKSDSLNYMIFKEDRTKSIKIDDHIHSQIEELHKDDLISSQNNTLTSHNEEHKELQSDELVSSEDIVNGDTVINIMILYTQDFANHYGVNTNTRIQYLLDLANEGFENSKTDVVLNLIHSQLYTNSLVQETYTIGTALNNLKSNDILALKRKHKADIVSLFRRYKGGGGCGLASLLSSASTSDARRSSFNVVEDKQSVEGGYYCSDLSFVHEVGHNFGCDHDRDHSTGGGGIFSYSFGHDIVNEFATIMSYDSPEINYFSNPSVTYNGLATGIAQGNSNSADNARTIRETKYYVDNQFLEDLESGDQNTSTSLQGVLSNVDDRDLFKMNLNGEVNFYNNDSLFINIYDANGNLVVVGDGYATLTHTFANGTYDVVLASTNDDTYTYYNNTNESYSFTYSISGPIAKAGADQTVNEGQTVTFDASSSSGTIVSYEWKEGNTILSTQSSFSKSDFTVGVHTIVLKVVDNQNNSSTDTIIVTVNKKDTDNDGTPDETDTDDDNDTMPDTYENANGLNPLVNDASLDLDMDGKTNLQEYQENTNPNDKYSKIFTLNLKTGWNLVSLELNSTVDLTSLSNQNIEVIRSLQNNTWKDWNKTSNSNTLNSLEDGYGYWIKSSQDTSLNILGNGIANTQSIVPNQWNMIGSRTISDINDFFTNNPNVKMIWTYENGEYKAISKDTDIQNDLDSKSIPLIQNIEANESFFVK